MHHNTYDRFCGSWWGSIIGQTITHQADDPFAQPWLLARRQIAQLLLEQQVTITNFSNFTDFFSSLALPFGEGISTQPDSLKYNSNLLALLPLIIFSPDEQDLCGKLREKHNLKSANYSSYIYFSQQVLIWSYLLTTILNNQFNPSSPTGLIEEILTQRQMPENPVTDKLQLVCQGIQQGNSLAQMVEQVSATKQCGATAIALAWYCFATTPQDFKLSVKRSARIDSNINSNINSSSGGLITALTATLSGAYNGMKLISQGWNTEPEQEQYWHIENQLLTKLFKSWLGVYAVEKNHEHYNLEFDAIARPRLIQPRQHLKIISQFSY
jgi:hypothetical protein